VRLLRSHPRKRRDHFGRDTHRTPLATSFTTFLTLRLSSCVTANDASGPRIITLNPNPEPLNPLGSIWPSTLVNLRALTGYEYEDENGDSIHGAGATSMGGEGFEEQNSEGSGQGLTLVDIFQLNLSRFGHTSPCPRV